MTFLVSRYAWLVLVFLPLAALAQFAPPPSLNVLTPDQVFEELGVPARMSDITGFLRAFSSDLWFRFMASRGGDVLLDIEAKTGIDLPKFLSFAFGIFWYLFLEIYAVLADIAAKLSAPR